jgi:hypothetical protein
MREKSHPLHCPILSYKMSNYSASPSNKSPNQSRESSIAPSERIRQYGPLLPTLGPFTIEEAQQKVEDNLNLNADVLQNIIKGIQSHPS